MRGLDEFRGRLLKNHKHWSKWARRQGLQCYRLYDRDVPTWPWIIDRYADWVHLQEYATGWQQSDEAYLAWTEQAVQTVAEVLDIPSSQVAIKRRERQRGLAQYQALQPSEAELAAARFVVEESGLRFAVDLRSYLDTGLFLDHRPARSLMRSLAAGQRVLNLFSYTGSFTVYMVAGGAASSLTVDLSRTYLDWAAHNLSLNQLQGPEHDFLQTDCMEFLRTIAPESFDLIVLDPPSFSNSKRMDGILDVQRDYAWMVEQAWLALAPGGTLFFSTNRQDFVWQAPDVCAPWAQEITAQTVAPDFARHQPHRAFLLKKPARAD